MGTYAIGKRDSMTTQRFIEDLLQRIVLPTREELAAGTQRPQISTDGWPPYPVAIANSVGHRVSFGVLAKRYGENSEAGQYAPAQIISTDREVRCGGKDEMSICTSHDDTI